MMFMKSDKPNLQIVEEYDADKDDKGLIVNNDEDISFSLIPGRVTEYEN